MPILVNTLSQNGTQAGTGTLGIQRNINYIRAFQLVEAGTTFDITTDDLNRATIDGLVKDNKYIVLPRHFAVSFDNEDTQYETSNSGNKAVVRDGLFEFMPEFQEGAYFGNSLACLNERKWDVFMVDFDSKGISAIWGEKTVDGKLKGFSTALVFAEKMILNDGSGVTTKNPLKIQLDEAGTQALKGSKAFVTSENSFDFLSLDGINDVVLTATDLTASNFSVSAKLASDNFTNISSVVTVSNWRITDTSSGAAVLSTGITYANDVYTIAGVPAGTYTVEFYDVTNSKEVIISGNRYYNSNTITVTLT